MKQKNAQHSIELAELQQKLDWQNSMLSSTENALVSTDLSGTIVSFNTAAEKLFGYTADEVVDIHTGAVVHLEEEIIAYAKELSLELNKTIAPGFEVLVLLSLNNSRQIKKWNMVRKNGSQFPARVIVKAIYDQQGDAIGFLADIIDLTELNKTRKKEKENITLYKDLFESFSYALFLLDGEYLVDCNSATLKMFECTKEQIIGQLASRFTPERQLDGRLSSEKIVEVLNLALAGESYLMEWLACRYDGTLIRTELSLNVVYMDGKPYVHAAVRDITEHYNLQQTLASERIRLKSIFNDMQTMIGILDVDGKLIFINNTPLNITGVKEGEVLNTLFSQATWFNYDENLTKKIQQDFENTLKGNNTLRELQVYTPQGHLWIYIAMHPIVDDKGQTKEVLVEGYDISDLKRTEEHLRRSQKMDALGKLTGGIAHDYNNMLGVIVGYAELLEDELLAQPELKSYVTEIITASERSIKLTRKLLDFSRVKVLETSAVNLNEILLKQQGIIEKAVTAAVSINFNLAKDLWILKLEKNDFEDVLLNLCINSMHATENISMAKIELNTCNETIDEINASAMQLNPGDYVKFSLYDNGCGMSKEVKLQVFDPFFSTKGEKGTGLGLSQVYSFVKRSHGAISVYSEEGKGTEFSLYFPRNCKSSDINKELPPIEAINSSEEGTILVVDDEPSLVRLASQILTKQGYKVIKANSAEEALDHLKQNSVDLLLSDIIMPDMGGVELANIVQKKYPNIKIQLASGFTSETHLKENEYLGNKILAKPYNKKGLITCVKDILKSN
jgi:PAS domain S-box-containing protein